MKKKVKRKFNFKKFFKFILSLIILYLLVSYIFSVKTKNIIILNSNYYSDELIIEQADLENYPKFVTLKKQSIKDKLKKLELIEDVKISKKLGFVLKIEIKEKKILYFVRSNNAYKLSDNTNYNSDKKYICPTLINFVPADIEKEFIEKLSKLDTNTINLISEIEYSKTEYDKERFLLYMVDGNEVYINNNKIDKLNKYMSIVTKLGGKKGILYLDSGSYFEIKEK